jgi:multicomponent Na+:H+ antiporter subunit G
MTPLELVGALFIIAGTLLSVLAAWGVLDFPSALARMHAATKSASLGLSLIVFGAAIDEGSWGLLGMAALVATFLFLTAPISGHMVGRATYLAGRVDNLVHDDLAGAPHTPLAVGNGVRSGFSAARLISVTVIWMLLWREVSPGTLLGGAAAAAVIEGIRKAPVGQDSIRLRGLLVFAARYIQMVFVSNARVAWEVITPSNEQIREAIVAVPLASSTPAVGLLVANAISFTPGSLTIEMTGDPLVLYVHVLHFESVEQVERDVRKLEAYAGEVFQRADTVGSP